MFERGFIDKAIGYTIAGLVCFLIVLMFYSVIAIEIAKKPAVERERILVEQRQEFERMIARQKPNENLPDVWPAQMNEVYPDITLFDQTGREFRVSDLKGRVIILEYVDMSSPISQAQSGANDRGAYGVMQDIDQYARPFADILKKDPDVGIALPHHDVIELKIIVYTQDGLQPSRDDAQNWAAHFGFEKDKGVIVAVAKKDLRSVQTQDLVTGFQLLDKKLRLRVDSAGQEPKHNLRTTFVGLVPKLLR